MSDPRDLIIEPIVSEKSYALLERNVYTFRVRPDATKPQIHDAVEQVFNVRVLKVNTLNRKGGGHKQQYRIIDFKRTKDGVPAKVHAVEYDPNRNCRILLLHYLDGEKRYILAPKGAGVGDLLQSGQGSEIRPGNALPMRYIPVGTVIHNVELKPGGGGKMARSAGSSVQLVAKEGDFATLRLPSTEMRRVPIDCRATVGEVGDAG